MQSVSWGTLFNTVFLVSIPTQTPLVKPQRLTSSSALFNNPNTDIGKQGTPRKAFNNMRPRPPNSTNSILDSDSHAIVDVDQF